jgi:hypothetical protein
MKFIYEETHKINLNIEINKYLFINFKLFYFYNNFKIYLMKIKINYIIKKNDVKRKKK